MVPVVTETDKKERLAFEDKLIMLLRPRFNKIRSGGISEDWREYYRKYMETHREEYNERARERMRKYVKTHPEEYRAYMREYMREYRARRRQEKLEAQSSRPLF